MISPVRLVRVWRSIGLAILATLCFGSASASAATLNVVGGQLLGASGVIVDGFSYNVEFIKADRVVCIRVLEYNGCDEVSDFTFQTFDAAILAANALFDQVFLDGTDLFDSHPELTVGCEDVQRCGALTVYGLFELEDGTYFRGRMAKNYQDPQEGVGVDEVLYYAKPTDAVHTSGGRTVYAVWSVGVVPEPGTAVLMGLGLLGLSVSNRRER